MERLTRDEDDDLRRLYWLSQNGTLSRLFEERLLERRLRDRRADIRQPRELDPSGSASSPDVRPRSIPEDGLA